MGLGKVGVHEKGHGFGTRSTLRRMYRTIPGPTWCGVEWSQLLSGMLLCHVPMRVLATWPDSYSTYSGNTSLAISSLSISQNDILLGLMPR